MSDAREWQQSAMQKRPSRTEFFARFASEIADVSPRVHPPCDLIFPIKETRGQRLGGALLWDAAQRAGRSEVAVFALVVDAKNDPAEAFYRHHGFVAFGSLPRFVLPLAGFIGKSRQ